MGDDFLLYFACGMSVLGVSGNNQPAYWDSTCLGTAFPWWKCPVEICLCSLCTAQDFLGISLIESLRNAPLKTYYTP